MDDQQSYLLNGLLGRQFALGRIIRFRKVDYGRQAVTYELLTAEHREYLVWMMPGGVDRDHLDFVAASVNLLDGQRFSVAPFFKHNSGGYAAEGPQGSVMLVSLPVAGRALPARQYTEHDISQVALRLAWMHRLFKERLAEPAAGQPSLAVRVEELMAHGGAALAESPLLLSLLRLPAAQGWVHGDIQAAALLHDDDHQLRTIVDWGLLHFGAPLEDLIDAFLALCTDALGKLDQARGTTLLESYDSLTPIRRIPWTPVVASWLGQRLLDAEAKRRALPRGFEELLAAPERLSTALASCM